MGDVAGRAVEALALCTHRLDEQHSPVLPAPKLPGSFEANSEHRELASKAELCQRPHHVGCDHDPGTDLAQLRRLFVDRGGKSRFSEKQCSRESAEATPHYRDAHFPSACIGMSSPRSFIDLCG